VCSTQWQRSTDYPGLVADLSPAPRPAEQHPHGLDAVTGTKPRPEPLDPPMVPFALAGMAAFVIAGLILLASHDWLAEHGHTSWLWICLAGFLSGIPGLITMLRHDANRRRRRALSHAEFRVDDQA
jgi:hypothetical protein